MSTAIPNPVAPTPAIVVRNITRKPISLTGSDGDTITIHPKATTTIHAKFASALTSGNARSIRRLA